MTAHQHPASRPVSARPATTARAIACALVLLSAGLTSRVGAATQSDELIAVQPDELPVIWKKTRGSLPSPWETFAPGHASETRCVKSPSARNTGEICGTCAAIGFIVESNGRTSNVRTLRETPDNPSSRLVVSDVRRWRFEPTERNASRTPAFSYIVYVNVLRTERASDDPALVGELDRMCRVDPLVPDVRPGAGR